MKKGFLFLAGILSLIFETLEKGEGGSFGALAALFFVLWVWEFLSEKAEERLDRFSLRRFLLLQSRIHLSLPANFAYERKDVVAWVLTYTKNRYTSDAGFKTKGGETLVSSVLVRATFLSWLRLTIDSRKDGTGSLRPVIIVERKTWYFYITLLVGITFILARIVMTYRRFRTF